MLGFPPEDGQAAGAALMRAYYQHAATVHRFAEGLIARVTRTAQRQFFRRMPIRKIRHGVIVQQIFEHRDPDFFKEDPLNLITIYADCQAHGSVYPAAHINWCETAQVGRR